MLPELEKVIPKPLKKRYRDLFEDGNRTDIQNVSSNKIGIAFANPSHIPHAVKKEVNCQLHRPNNLYRKSVIKRSITKHISIIGLEQIAPSEASIQDEANFQIETDENQTSHFVYLSENYLASPVQFVGKLKVKWREKYENYGDNDRDKTVLDEFNSYGCVKNNEKKGHKCAKCRKEPTNDKRYAVDDDAKSEENEANAEQRMADDNSSADDSKQVPVRKLERARKGLIYQKFMAATYSWNKKEKASSKTTTDPSQPRKRGRPRNVPEVDNKRSKTADLSISDTTVTVMRLERKKNSGTVKYAVVERKNSKKSSFVVKKT